MGRIAEGIHWLAVTAWVGALWTVGLMVAPTLFHHIPDRVIAGSLAGRLFTYTALLGLACGGYLLLFRLARFGGQALRQAFFWVVLAMTVLSSSSSTTRTTVLFIAARSPFRCRPLRTGRRSGYRQVGGRT